jgi:hypothetical protein
MVEQNPTWVPVDACTLPTAEVPLRLSEFDELLARTADVRRLRPDLLRLRLVDEPGLVERARDLTEREMGCCTFFDFAVRHEAAAVVIDVRVPPGRTAVLDGIAAQARRASA